MSLDDVAAQNREPDFFELLQAGMLSGSLGAPGVDASFNPKAGRSDKYPVAGGNGPQPPDYVDPDDKVTLQILRIGANIIDQWDADSFPTTISYTAFKVVTSTNTYTSSINVQGIEDLPYPFASYLNVYAPTTATTGPFSVPTPLAPFYFYLYFEMWNPHQTPASVSTANYPTAFRFFPFYNNAVPGCSDSFVAGFDNSGIPVVSGTTTTYKAASWFYNGTLTTPNGNAGPPPNHTPFYLNALAPAGVAFSYSPTTTANDYREPALAVGTAVGGTAPSPWNTNACLVLPPLTNFPSANQKANQRAANTLFPANASGPSGPKSGWQCQYYFHMVMPVQYQDGAGNWHTYTTFIGMDDPSNPAAFPSETAYGSYGGDSPPNTTASLSTAALVKSDPRTSRFGTGVTSSTPDVNVPLANVSGMVTTVTASQPFGSALSPYRMDWWAQNDSTTSSKYADTDGVVRWGDAHNTYVSGLTSPLFTGDTANRPVILNRPFKSVGELGYVYRDMPWKTLDMFSANSADSGLLDLFTLSEAPVLAGRVNPNTPYPQVLAALISGGTQGWSGTTVSTANALALGNAMTTASAITPFASRADIVNNFMTNSAVTGVTAIKTEEEAAVRAIAESANTRTWNFMVDIVAQSGRYPSTATSLDNFVVEGQRRYWLHIAIDRYTGQVVDKQLEVVNE